MVAWLLVGCFGGRDPVVEQGPAEGPLAPLSQAPRTPWLQQVWWQGAAGDVVEGVTTISGDRSALVIGVAHTDGGREALKLEGPGVSERMGHRVPELSRAGVSDIGPDGHTRVSVERRGTTAAVSVADTVAGGQRDLMRDPGALTLRHPSVAPDGEAVFVTEEGALGGVWRIALADGAATQVAPGPAATATALVLDDGRPAVAFLEEPAGEAPRVVVAVPAGDAAADAAGLVGDWWPVAEIGGRPVRLEGCAPGPALRVGHDEAGWTLQAGATLVADRALSCGAGCLALALRTPAGAPRLVAELRGDLWWADPSLGLAPGLPWRSGAEAEAMGVLRSCPPALAPGAWLSFLRYRGGPRASLSAIEVQADRLTVHGRKGERQPFVATLTHADGEPRTQLSRADVRADATGAVSPDGSLEVRLEGATLTGVRGLAGVVWAAPAEVRPTGVAFAPDGSWLAVSDAGTAPGIWRVKPGEAAVRLVDAAAPSAPVLFLRDGEVEVAWVDRLGGEAVVMGARPVDPVARQAWLAGPAGVADVVSRWAAAQVRDGALVRCGGADVSLELDGDGLALRAGAAAAAVVGGYDTPRGGLTLLGRGPGGPRVVADLLPAGQPAGAVVWRDRVALGLPWEVVWLPASDAAALPDGGPCRGR